jgi:hypothetical protein
MSKMTYVAAVLFAAPAFAQDLPPLTCEGNSPDWTLTLAGPDAQFAYVDANDMQVVSSATPENADWPNVSVLLANRQTAIVAITPRLCSSSFVTDFPFDALVMTQKGETPVVLTGCCTIAE